MMWTMAAKQPNAAEVVERMTRPCSARVVFGLVLFLAAPGCGSGSGLSDADSLEESDVPDLGEALEDGVGADEHDGDDDAGPNDMAPEEGSEEGSDDVGEDGSDADGATPDCPSNTYLPAPTTATPGWWSPGSTEGLYETPSGYAWARRAESGDSWFLVRTPATFDSFDTSLGLEGLPVTVAGGESAPLGVAVVGAFEPTDSRLLFVMHPATGGTYGVVYGLDGRPASAAVALDGWPTDLAELRGLYAASTASGFAVLICRQDPAALPETCIGCRAVGVAAEGGTVGTTSEINGLSFNAAAVGWDGAHFVVVHTPGCGAPAAASRWVVIAPDGVIDGPRELEGVPPGPLFAPAQVGETELGFVLERFPAPGHVQLHLVRIGRDGSLIGGPTPVFDAGAVGDVRITTDPQGGYALLVSTVPPDADGNRVQFLRLGSDGAIVQQTVLADSMATTPQVPVLRWRDDHFVAAWGHPVRIGSLACASSGP